MTFLSGHCYLMLADFLRYPESGLRSQVENCQNETLSPFVNYVCSVSDTEWEEMYIRTFDIQAICYLEVGYVLFGEDYKRGHFLVKMQGLQREHENDCGSELSDHLTNILTLLPKMKDQGEAHDMVERLVLPAITKMLQGFSRGGNVYQVVLQTIFETLKKDYGCLDVPDHHRMLDLPAYRSTPMRGVGGREASSPDSNEPLAWPGLANWREP